MTLWPSGLRRNVKAVVLIGGGSNPLDVIIFFCIIGIADRCCWLSLTGSVSTVEKGWRLGFRCASFVFLVFDDALLAKDYISVSVFGKLAGCLLSVK